MVNALDQSGSLITLIYTTARRAGVHSAFTNECLTWDSQNEAAVHCLDGYIAVTRLPDWSRAFYRNISTQMTHGSLVLKIQQTFESFPTRPSTRDGTDT